ncbi:MAG: ECF-type sigma factor, partial [Acidobacteriota bacterium]
MAKGPGKPPDDAVEPPITALLGGLSSGEPGAEERLAEAVVGRLERIAGREMARRNDGHLHGLTLEPRVLAHDALLKILRAEVSFD